MEYVPLQKIDIANALVVKPLRVNIVGTIVQSFVSNDKNYGFLIIDDGTETMRIKCWSESVPMMAKAKVGDIVRVIGEVKEYEGEVYISPEILKRLADPNWEIVQKLEILKQDRIPQQQVEQELPNPAEHENEKTKILEIIKAHAEGIAAEEIAALLKLSDEKCIELIAELMNEGEIFEPKPRQFKLLP